MNWNYKIRRFIRIYIWFIFMNRWPPAVKRIKRFGQSNWRNWVASVIFIKNDHFSKLSPDSHVGPSFNEPHCWSSDSLKGMIVLRVWVSILFLRLQAQKWFCILICPPPRSSFSELVKLCELQFLSYSLSYSFWVFDSKYIFNSKDSNKSNKEVGRL